MMGMSRIAPFNDKSDSEGWGGLMCRNAQF